jgi:MFS family permease
MRGQDTEPLDRSVAFKAVMVGSSALGAGALLASLTVVNVGPSGFEFHWNNWAIAAFVIGAVLAGGFWLLVFRLSARGGNEKKKHRRLMLLSGFLLLVAFGLFLYPLRFVTPERRNDVLIGLGVAVAVLSVVGFLLRTVVKWLEEESDETDPPDA